MKRQPTGIPAGGQFAADQKAEPAGTLKPDWRATMPARLKVSAVNLSNDEVGQIIHDGRALEAAGLRGTLAPATPGSYKDDELEWTSVSGNVMILSGINSDTRRARLKSNRSDSGMVQFRAGSASPAELVDMAKRLDRSTNLQRAWAGAGAELRETTQVQGISMDENDIIIVNVRTGSGVPYSLHHDPTTKQTTGEVSTRDGSQPMDAEDVGMYVNRTLGVNASKPGLAWDSTMVMMRRRVAELENPQQ